VHVTSLCVLLRHRLQVDFIYKMYSFRLERRSVERIRRKAPLPFGSQQRISRIQPSRDRVKAEEEETPRVGYRGYSK